MFESNAEIYDSILTDYVHEAESLGETPSKIPAIKMLREKTGLSLAAAKDAVENFGARNGHSTLVRMEPGLAPLLILASTVLIALVGLGVFFYLGR